MECSHAQPLIAAYLDGELERAEARELEAHVDDCPACRESLAQLGELRLALRSGATRHRAPPELRARVAGAAAESARTGAAVRRGSAGSGWRLAAAVVLAFAAGGGIVDLWNSGGAAPDERALLAHDLFASHWRALAAASPVDVVSSDRHTVKPWFAGKVAQSPLVADFADAGFPLVGGRVDYVGSERVPVLVYRHGQHLIDVFLLPAGAAQSLAQPLHQQGYAAERVTLGAQPAAVVSDLDRVELAKFEQLLARGGD